MSYATLPTFEGNRLGVRRMGMLSGVGGVLTGLGDAETDSIVQLLLSSGYTQSDINTLLQGGANAIDLSNLLNGSVTFNGLLSNLYPTSPSASGINPAIPPVPTNSVQTALTTQPTSPSPASAPQSPPGSILSYSVSFANTQGTTTPGAIAYLQANLPTYRMSLIGPPKITSSGLLFSAPAFSVNVLDSVGHAYISQVQGVLDMLMQNYTHQGADPSMIQMVTPGGSGGVLSPALTPPPVAAPDLTSWFEANWGFLAAALAAIAILPPLVKKL